MVRYVKSTLDDQWQRTTDKSANPVQSPIIFVYCQVPHVTVHKLDAFHLAIQTLYPPLEQTVPYKRSYPVEVRVTKLNHSPKKTFPNDVSSPCLLMRILSPTCRPSASVGT
jgi:hypothetical protein